MKVSPNPSLNKKNNYFGEPEVIFNVETPVAR